jgi:hypothetical protein
MGPSQSNILHDLLGVIGKELSIAFRLKAPLRICCAGLQVNRHNLMEPIVKSALVLINSRASLLAFPIS